MMMMMIMTTNWMGKHDVIVGFGSNLKCLLRTIKSFCTIPYFDAKEV
jgi:hypothetical protein